MVYDKFWNLWWMMAMSVQGLIRKAKVGDARGAARSKLEGAHQGEKEHDI